MSDAPLSISSTAPLEVERTMTDNKPSDHFTEVLYALLIVLLLSFVFTMSHVHNDSLAGKGMDFVYLILGALTQASTGGMKR